MKTIGTKKHYKNNNNKSKASMTLEPLSLLSEEKMMVYQYFTLLGNGKVDAILDMFIEEEEDDDMAIVYEPFSKEQGLRGKDAIRSFLQVAALANSGLEKTIEILQPEVKKIAKAKGEENSTITITALVTFIRGGSIKGRFEFDFVTGVDSNNRNNHLDKPMQDNAAVSSKTLDRNNTFKETKTKKIKMLKIQFI